jgi:F0F1-type ATP synthase delta subunit
MLDASLAARYANALFSTAQEQRVTAVVLEELGS